VSFLDIRSDILRNDARSVASGASGASVAASAMVDGGWVCVAVGFGSSILMCCDHVCMPNSVFTHIPMGVTGLPPSYR